MAEDYEPTIEYFDVLEAAAAGMLSPQGKVMKICVSCEKDLEAVLMKSDAAQISIPELELEVRLL